MAGRGGLRCRKVVDMEWKFGVTAATDEIGQIGATYLHLKLVIDAGNGAFEEVFMELTLPQFYDFLADMEKAKSHIDLLST